MTLVCQGATTATRAVAFPTDDLALETNALDDLPKLRANLGWQGSALAGPARAAVETARALAPHVTIEPALRDCDYGSWAGEPMSRIQDDQPEALAGWLSDPDVSPPGGESVTVVIERLRAWLATRSATPGRHLVVVSPFVVRGLVVAALDLPLPLFWRLDAAPLTLTRLTAQRGRWRLATFGAAP